MTLQPASSSNLTAAKPTVRRNRSTRQVTNRPTRSCALKFLGVPWFGCVLLPKPGTRTFLHIGAANYRSHVWVNTKRACDHEGGYTPFDCEVTAVLHPGSNFVVIAVDATRMVDGIPSVGIDWMNYGGLTRDVSLVTVPAAFIDDYDVHLAHGPAFQPGSPTHRLRPCPQRYGRPGRARRHRRHHRHPRSRRPRHRHHRRPGPRPLRRQGRLAHPLVARDPQTLQGRRSAHAVTDR